LQEGWVSVAGTFAAAVTVAKGNGKKVKMHID